MKKAEEPKFKTLSWYLNFITEDLSKLSPLEFRKLILEAQNHLISPAPTSPYSSDQWDTLGSFPVFDANGLSFKSIRPDYPWREKLGDAQRELVQLLQEASSWKPPRVKGVKGEEFIGFLKTPVPVNLHLLFSNGRMNKFLLAPLLDSSGDFNIVDLAKTHFIQLLDGVPFKAIKNCEECGKFFLHLSKKERKFCTPRCTSRAMSRQRREKNPEEYRRKQRELMKKRREEKTARSLNKPVEKIIFQKRK